MAPNNDYEDDSEINFNTPPTSTSRTKPAVTQTGSRFADQEAREAALKQELQNIQSINHVIENVIESLDKAKDNLQTVSSTVTSASTLLDTWTRILSQTEHNQRLILNPHWQGASQDLADVENEEQRMRQEAQRRQIEEQQRKEAAARKAEEDERKRAAASSTRGTRGLRGSNRTTGRPASAANGGSSSGYGRVTGSSTRGVNSRAGSSAGRSIGTAGRTRGTRGRGTS